MKLNAVIIEEACRENGYRWLVLDENHRKHWLTGREFSPGCSRKKDSKIILTYQSSASFGLYFASNDWENL